MPNDKRPAILLMDEDTTALEQLQTMLQREGYRVFVAVDGYAALRLAKKENPSLIVSDLLLAGLDAYEVWHILDTDPEAKEIPLLVLSALHVPPAGTPWRPGPNAEWRLFKYDAFLPKPIDLRRFMRVVKKLVHPNEGEVIPGGPSVFIVVEGSEFQEKLADALRQSDFEVETVCSLADAPKLLNAIPPAILLLDYRNQDEVVRRVGQQIKRSAPGTAIALIVDPNKAMDTDLAEISDGLLTVPVNSNQIITCINHTLDLSLMQQRIGVLSNKLISTNLDLFDAQHVLRAQNEELRHINTRLRELDSLKEILTSMVAHDLRTPLSAVLGALSLLSTDPDLEFTERGINLITGAMTAANQMVRLTETLLEKQRLEEGHLEPDQEPFHLPTVVEICLQQVTPLTTSRRLTIETFVPNDLPLIYADPHISQRVLENLLDNAIKFSPRGGTITVSGVLEQNFVKVSVVDQGPGIPEEQQKTIFDQFTQLKNKEKPSTRSGFGLGLTFCYLAAQAMGGTIWVESDGQTGTSFLFTLPVYDEAQVAFDLER